MSSPLKRAASALRELAAAIKEVEEGFDMLDGIGGIEGLEAVLRERIAKAEAERERAEASAATATVEFREIAKRWNALIAEIKKDRRINSRAILGGVVR